MIVSKQFNISFKICKYLYLITMFITFSMTMPHANIHIILMNVTHMLIAPLIAKSIDLVDE